MKLILILLAIIFGYILFTIGRIVIVSKIANLPTISQPQKKLGSGPTFTYVAAGDSTALGIGASVAEKTYTYQIANYLAKKFEVNYTNLAKSGATTTDILNTQLEQIVQAKPDIITISIGANDVTHLKNSDTILNNFKLILEQLKNRTSAPIYITNIPRVEKAELFPFVYQRYLADQVNWLNPKLLELNSDRVTFIDIHNYGWHRYPNESVTFAKDKFHPNDEGYRNWTEAFLSQINKVY